jgi:DMSO/TMAO reductase YedYZ molybdopterin-dependent catalytic subunit
MIVRSTRPEDLEMPLSGFSDYITPVQHFFVRTHVYVPTVSLNDWRLKVDGETATPLMLTMQELRMMPSLDLVAVTECAGNGRWRGIRLADVLKHAGIKPSAVEVLC